MRMILLKIIVIYVIFKRIHFSYFVHFAQAFEILLNIAVPHPFYYKYSICIPYNQISSLYDGMINMNLGIYFNETFPSLRVVKQLVV